MSEGLSFRQLLPSRNEPTIAFLKKRLDPITDLLAMSMTATLEKNSSR